MENIERRFINKCISTLGAVRNKLSNFSYSEIQDDDYDDEPDYYSESSLEDVLKAQIEKLDDLTVNLSDYLEGYSEYNSYELENLQGSLLSISDNLHDILDSLFSFSFDDDHSMEIDEVIEEIDESIDELRSIE